MEAPKELSLEQLANSSSSEHSDGFIKRTLKHVTSRIKKELKDIFTMPVRPEKKSVPNEIMYELRNEFYNYLDKNNIKKTEYINKEPTLEELAKFWEKEKPGDPSPMFFTLSALTGFATLWYTFIFNYGNETILYPFIAGDSSICMNPITYGALGTSLLTLLGMSTFGRGRNTKAAKEYEKVSKIIEQYKK